MASTRVPDILLIDVKLEELGAFESLSRTLKQTPPETAVLVTAPDATVDSVCRVMRLGVADFIPHPLTRENVIGALQIATAKRVGHGGGGRLGGRVISFVRSCGGAGATTLAIQTGWELLQRSPKGKGSVCLVDLDLQFGNMAISLDMQGQFGLAHVLEGMASLDGALLRGAVSHHPSGLDLLAAPGRILALDALSRQCVDTILDVARQEYEFAVADLPHAWTDWTFEVLAKSDLVVLVADLSVTGVDRLRRELQLLADEGMADAPLLIVANRFEKTWRYRDRLKRAEAVIGRKIDCFVRYNRIADEARDKGVLLRNVRRGSNIEKDVKRLSELVRNSLRAEPVLQAAAFHQ
jgi:Flp pilus assembly CpaE family ATPase